MLTLHQLNSFESTDDIFDKDGSPNCPGIQNTTPNLHERVTEAGVAESEYEAEGDEDADVDPLQLMCWHELKIEEAKQDGQM